MNGSAEIETRSQIPNTRGVNLVDVYTLPDALNSWRNTHSDGLSPAAQLIYNQHIDIHAGESFGARVRSELGIPQHYPWFKALELLQERTGGHSLITDALRRDPSVAAKKLEERLTSTSDASVFGTLRAYDEDMVRLFMQYFESGIAMNTDEISTRKAQLETELRPWIVQRELLAQEARGFSEKQVLEPLDFSDYYEFANMYAESLDDIVIQILNEGIKLSSSETKSQHELLAEVLVSRAQTARDENEVKEKLRKTGKIDTLNESPDRRTFSSIVNEQMGNEDTNPEQLAEAFRKLYATGLDAILSVNPDQLNREPPFDFIQDTDYQSYFKALLSREDPDKKMHTVFEENEVPVQLHTLLKMYNGDGDFHFNGLEDFITQLFQDQRRASHAESFKRWKRSLEPKRTPVDSADYLRIAALHMSSPSPREMRVLSEMVDVCREAKFDVDRTDYNTLRQAADARNALVVDHTIDRYRLSNESQNTDHVKNPLYHSLMIQRAQEMVKDHAKALPNGIIPRYHMPKLREELRLAMEELRTGFDVGFDYLDARRGLTMTVQPLRDDVPEYGGGFRRPEMISPELLETWLSVLFKTRDPHDHLLKVFKEVSVPEGLVKRVCIANEGIIRDFPPEEREHLPAVFRIGGPSQTVGVRSRPRTQPIEEITQVSTVNADSINATAIQTGESTFPSRPHVSEHPAPRPLDREILLILSQRSEEERELMLTNLNKNGCIWVEPLRSIVKHIQESNEDSDPWVILKNALCKVTDSPETFLLDQAQRSRSTSVSIKYFQQHVDTEAKRYAALVGMTAGVMDLAPGTFGGNRVSHVPLEGSREEYLKVILRQMIKSMPRDLHHRGEVDAAWQTIHHMAQIFPDSQTALFDQLKREVSDWAFAA